MIVTLEIYFDLIYFRSIDHHLSYWHHQIFKIDVYWIQKYSLILDFHRKNYYCLQLSFQHQI